MFEIHLEWEEAPGVRDRLLAQTWARLEFRLDGKPMTKYWSDRAQSLRDGVHGSVFPLADWVAAHWWSLLYEGLRHHPSELSARRDRPRAEDARQWLRRHNILTCREGMAYPDLTVYRMDEEVVLCWFPDPSTTTTQGRFMDGGMVCLDRAMVEAALESLVERVLERARGIDDEHADALTELWGAISESRRNRDEAALCQRLAMLGQDPYAEGSSEAVEELLEQLPFGNEVVRDLLSASTPEVLKEDVRSTAGLLAGLPASSGPHVPRMPVFVPRARNGLLPYLAGYARASEVREHLGLSDDEPLRDLEGVIERLMGELVQVWPSRGGSSVDAAVMVNGVASLSAGERSTTAKRFLLGRALHHWLYVTSDTAPQRLLTKGHDWLQASSRAFAAELLAPARALSSRLGGRADWGEQQEELADEFQVNPMVIAHQIENHRLD